MHKLLSITPSKQKYIYFIFLVDSYTNSSSVSGDGKCFIHTHLRGQVVPGGSVVVPLRPPRCVPY